MKKTLLIMMAITAMAFVACNDPVKKAENAASGNATEQTTGQPAEAAQGQQTEGNNTAVSPNGAPSATPGTNATPTSEKKLPVPSDADMKKLGLTGNMDQDVKTVVKAIVEGSNALRDGKDPKEVDKVTQKLLETAAGYYKSKGKLEEFNNKRDNVMREELTKELAKQKK